MRDAVAIVTGGGRGIGEAVALALAREGMHVVLGARSRDEVDAVASRITGEGGRAVTVPADVTDPDQVDRLVRTALGVGARIDVLVNAAGTLGPVGPLWEAHPESWRCAIEVNLYGTFLCCRAVLPEMIAQRRGKIINFSGGGAASPSPRLSAYGAAKAAVVRLTETLAEEVRPFGIQVNAVAPGMVDTRILDGILAAGERGGDHFARVRRLRESGEGGFPPELAASFVVWLASEASGSLTGKLIAAPYDGWERWDTRRIEDLGRSPWFTLRRLDHATLRPLVNRILGHDGG